MLDPVEEDERREQLRLLLCLQTTLAQHTPLPSPSTHQPVSAQVLRARQITSIHPAPRSPRVMQTPAHLLLLDDVPQFFELLDLGLDHHGHHKALQITEVSVRHGLLETVEVVHLALAHYTLRPQKPWHR